MAVVQLDNFDPSQLDRPPTAAGPQVVPLPNFDPSELDRQMEGIGRVPAMIGSGLLKGALQGAGAIGDLQDMLGGAVKRYAFDPINSLFMRQLGAQGEFSPREAAETSPLDSAHLIGYARALGAVDRPDLQPQSTGEKFIDAAAQGAGGVLPYLPLAAGGILANAARGLAQGAVAGTGGELAAESFPNHPEIARLGGTVAGALLGGKAFNAANRLAGAAGGASTPMLDAYRNLGIEPRLAGDVTGSPVAQMFQSYAAKAPGGANTIHTASEDAIGQWADALDRTAANFGNAKTLQDAGSMLQGASRDWLQRWRAAQQAAEAAVSAKVPPTTPVDITPVESLLQHTANAMPGLPSVGELMTEPVFKDLSTALAKDAGRGTAPWSDMRAFRTRVGEELQNSLLSRDGKQEAWRQLYGAISNAMSGAAAMQGAAPEWIAANAISHNGHNFVENVLGRFINSRNPAHDTIAPESAAKAALSGAANGGTDLTALRGEMPDAADELAAFKLRDMGLANAGQQNAAASRVSPGTFVTDYAKLSPEAKIALFKNDPRIRDLATVAGGMKSTERFLNTSNTGAHMATGHALGSALAAPAAIVEGYEYGGVPGAMASGLGALALPYVPSYAAARLTTSPALTRLFAAPAAAPVSSGLLDRATMLPPVLRALVGAAAHP